MIEPNYLTDLSQDFCFFFARLSYYHHRLSSGTKFAISLAICTAKYRKKERVLWKFLRTLEWRLLFMTVHKISKAIFRIPGNHKREVWLLVHVLFQNYHRVISKITSTAGKSRKQWRNTSCVEQRNIRSHSYTSATCRISPHCLHQPCSIDTFCRSEILVLQNI